MKDLRGHPIEVGDQVAYRQPTWEKYKKGSLAVGQVERFTAKRVVIGGQYVDPMRVVVIVLPEVNEANQEACFYAGCDWNKLVSK